MHRKSFVIYMASLALAGCRRSLSPALTPPSTPTPYEARGVLVRVTPAEGTAIISHEAIPGYMEGMTMEFKASHPEELRGLAPGDLILFRLSVTEERSWIDQIHKIGVAPVPAFTADAPDAGLHPGDLAPDCALIDSTGRRFQASEFRGGVLAIAFIFTRCPLPDYCPRISSQFTEAQRMLEQEPASTPWHLLSVSFDPEYDTPKRLAQYAAQMHADPAHWTVATGELEEVIRFGSAFGLAVSRERGQLTHNLRTAVVDAGGRVRKIYRGSFWGARDLVEDMRKAMVAV